MISHDKMHRSGGRPKKRWRGDLEAFMPFSLKKATHLEEWKAMGSSQKSPHSLRPSSGTINVDKI